MGLGLVHQARRDRLERDRGAFSAAELGRGASGLLRGLGHTPGRQRQPVAGEQFGGHLRLQPARQRAFGGRQGGGEHGGSLVVADALKLGHGPLRPGPPGAVLGGASQRPGGVLREGIAGHRPVPSRSPPRSAARAPSAPAAADISTASTGTPARTGPDAGAGAAAAAAWWIAVATAAVSVASGWMKIAITASTSPEVATSSTAWRYARPAPRRAGPPGWRWRPWRAGTRPGAGAAPPTARPPPGRPLRRRRRTGSRAAGVGDDPDPPPGRQRLVGQQLGNVEQLLEGVGADHPGLTEQRLHGHVGGGQ